MKDGPESESTLLQASRRIFALVSMIIAAVCSIGAVRAEDSKVVRIRVGFVQTGTLFWYGNRVEAPFTVESVVWVDSETTLVNTYVNGLPLRSSNRSERLFVRAGLARAAMRRKERSALDAQGACAAIYRADPLVDSVHVESASGMVIFWKGLPPEHWDSRIRQVIKRRPGMHFERAFDLLNDLGQGRLVFVCNGGLVVMPRGSERRVLTQIDSLLAGFLQDLPLVRDGRVVMDLRDPMPIDTVLRDRGED